MWIILSVVSATVALLFQFADASQTSPLPHLVFVLVDDLGHNGVPWNAVKHPTNGNQDIIAPTLKTLANTGEMK